MSPSIPVIVVSVHGKNIRVMPQDLETAPKALRRGMTFKAPGIEVGTHGTVALSVRLNDYLFTPIFQD